ncbi:hypothetical protein WHT83_08825 [Aminobacter sp. P9b]|uniref:Uncharacterized protein n=1 Tax=Aminobacter niigataensis TaxID=83265 RepID=A0ABR6L6U1_9HYPH|nr:MULTISPECIES: hypothetical protein [Aminobacter]MBB4652504.1 hypothetical protein [Aminobacter niigataensis]
MQRHDVDPEGARSFGHLVENARPQGRVDGSFESSVERTIQFG